MKARKILDTIDFPSFDLISETLDQLIELEFLEQVNWEKFPYKPLVSVQLAYNSKELFLKYKVKEQSVKAMITQPNGQVWNDSCVEFFISPESDHCYYNFEFNAIGTALLSYRQPNLEPVHANPSVIDSIRRKSTLGTEPFEERMGETYWELVVAIPFVALFHHHFHPPITQRINANFYKCGDSLAVPHFLSWTKIDTPEPCFHAPNCFGKLEFEI
ncbi:MAG: carbohydrate-binding family 9-like protein [Salinivirgaceae bacterium]|jgi:hypothetical protein